MSNITKLYWNELDGTVADVNDVKPIAEKVDEVIEIVNPLDNDVQDIKDSLSTGYQYLKGEFVEGSTTAQKWELWAYNGYYWVSLENNNTETPSITSTKWAKWDNRKTYFPSAAVFEMIAEKNRKYYDGSGYIGQIAKVATSGTDDNLIIANSSNGANILKITQHIKNINGYKIKITARDITLPNPPSDTGELFKQVLVFVEAWHELITEKDWWCPNGDVSYENLTFTCDDGTVINLDKITDKLGSGYQGYSAFGSWDTETIGYGKKWSELTDEEKISIISSKYQNICVKGDNIVQVRYRIRVVSATEKNNGIFDEEGINPQIGKYGYEKFFTQIADADTNIVVRGSSINAIDYDNTLRERERVFYTYVSKQNFIPKSYGYLPGAFYSDFNISKSYGKTSVIAMPIALVSRRNTGAYHPVYNPNGCAKFNDSGTAKYWYEYAHESTWSITAYTIVGVDTANSQFKISGDYTDIIKENYYITVSGSTGNDGRYYASSVTYDNGADQTIITVSETIPDTTADGSLKSDYQYVKYCFDNATGGTIESGISGRPDGLYADEINERDVKDLRLPAKTDETLYTEAGAERVMNTFVANEVRGVELSYKIQANTSASSITERWHDGINLASYLEEINYVYNNTMLWCDVIGDANNYPSSWLEFGITATPLVKDEDGNSVLPDASKTEWKLSRKYSSVKQVIKYSGGSFTLLAETADYALDSTNNTITFTSAPVSTDIIMVFYETYCNALEPVANSEVVGGVSEVIFMKLYNTNFGSVLFGNLINKVPIGLGNYDFEKVSWIAKHVLSYNKKFDYGNWGCGASIHQSPPVFDIQNTPAIKVFLYIIEKNGLLYPVFVFKELKYDSSTSSWGDDNKFQITNYVNTMTDLNGKTILYGQKISKIPLGFAKNTIIDID